MESKVPQKVDGVWVFPAAWPTAAQQAFAAAQVDIEAEAAALAQLEVDREAAADSIETQLLRARVAADDARRASLEARWALEDDAAWLKAQANHGARVGRLFVGGRWLVLHSNTDAVWRKVQRRAESLRQAAEEAAAGGSVQERLAAETKGAQDAMEAVREGVLAMVVSPLVDGDKGHRLDEVRKILDEYPEAWPELHVVRRALDRGPLEASGKGAAR